MENKRILKILIRFFIIIIIVLCLYQLVKVKLNTKRGDTSLFLGDSITERYKLDKYLSSYRTINSGVGGNTTSDILNDMDNRVYKYTFDKVFLLVGINDLMFTESSNEEIRNNIESIIDNIHDNNKHCIVFLESVYPVNTDINKDILDTSNNKIDDFNKELKKICDKKCIYIDINKDLKDKKGNLKKIYTKDGIHLNRIGYFKITRKLLEYLKY